jgi:hypothetical protein
MSTTGNIGSASKWLPGRWHGELDEDGENVYFSVVADDGETSTRLTTYASADMYRELCAMFKVTDAILPHREGEE